MARTPNKDILWEVGCEGHTDAWVVAPDWAQATMKAAEFWGVAWREVAAKCIEKRRIKAPPHNICTRCGRIYAGRLPFCAACEKVARTEEELLRRRLNRAYRAGMVV